MGIALRPLLPLRQPQLVTCQLLIPSNLLPILPTNLLIFLRLLPKPDVARVVEVALLVRLLPVLYRRAWALELVQELRQQEPGQLDPGQLEQLVGPEQLDWATLIFCGPTHNFSNCAESYNSSHRC